MRVLCHCKIWHSVYRKPCAEFEEPIARHSRRSHAMGQVGGVSVAGARCIRDERCGAHPSFTRDRGPLHVT